jgi:UDP-glucose 4-epimerase
MGVPNNLMPYVTQVAVGKRDYLSVYGGDWPTHDGTGVRDYIHVVDLAKGHVKALDYLLSSRGSLTVNLGAGKGYSVLDMVKAFEQASGKRIPYKIVDRRKGDIAAFYADASMAKEKLNWKVEYDLQRMCEDSWRWQSMNPEGYI